MMDIGQPVKGGMTKFYLGHDALLRNVLVCSKTNFDALRSSKDSIWILLSTTKWLQ